jgi:hypothetical protein
MSYSLAGKISVGGINWYHFYVRSHQILLSGTDNSGSVSLIRIFFLAASFFARYFFWTNFLLLHKETLNIEIRINHV